MLMVADGREGGVKNGLKSADVINGRPLKHHFTINSLNIGCSYGPVLPFRICRFSENTVSSLYMFVIGP